MAGKLGRRSEEELFIKEIIIRGVLLLQSGASPSVIESNLKAYLEPAERTKLGAKKEQVVLKPHLQVQLLNEFMVYVYYLNHCFKK